MGSRVWIAFAILLAVLAGEAGAGSVIYQWRDDNGKIHFTDNASAIPVQYWNQLPQLPAPLFVI